MNPFEPSTCRDRVSKLTPRQTDVLRALATGLSKKQIAAELDLSENTVRVYLERIYSILGVHNTALAVRVACAAKLV